MRVMPGNTDYSEGSLLDEAMCFAARNGLVAVSVSYRLAPAATWPSGAKDVAAALSWVYENAEQLGAAEDLRLFADVFVAAVACAKAQELCRTEVPRLEEKFTGSWASCHFPGA